MKAGSECPQTQGRNHWTHRLPERVPRGERNHFARLGAGEVLAIRRYVEKGMSYRAVGRLFRVDHTTVADIAKRKTWGHL